jgi:predicted NAD/FAD-binding protein
VRIGIIGGGAAGLVTAWLLQQEHEVCLFEKQDRLGGHAHTIDLGQDGQTVPIDAGFEFFMDRSTYPIFHRLLSKLDVPVRPFPASMTVYNPGGGRPILLPPWREGRLIWSAVSPSTFGDLFRLRKFLAQAARFLAAPDSSLTVRQYLDDLRLPPALRRNLVYPLLLGQFCMEPEDFDRCLARDVLKYTSYLGPGGLSPPKLFEIQGGTRAYITRLAASLKRTRIVTGAEIRRIHALDQEYCLGPTYRCDQVVVATNARVASELLSELGAARDLADALSCVGYYRTEIAIHGDRRWMPENPRHWSVINFRYDGRHSSISVWKPWRSRRPVFRSWISFDHQVPDPLYARVTYEHPRGDPVYYRVQQMIRQVQGNGGLWFAGSYICDIDSHESAVRSAIAVARGMGASIPEGWS